MWGKNPVGATLYKLKLILYEKFGFCMEAPKGVKIGHVSQGAFFWECHDKAVKIDKSRGLGSLNSDLCPLLLVWLPISPWLWENLVSLQFLSFFRLKLHLKAEKVIVLQENNSKFENWADKNLWKRQFSVLNMLEILVVSGCL